MLKPRLIRMTSPLKRPLKATDLITEDDNETVSPVFFWGAVSFTIGLVCTVVGWAIGHPFPMVEFGAYVTSALVSMAAAKRIEGVKQPDA